MDLKEITKLAELLISRQRYVEQVEKELRSAKAALTQIEEVDLPEAMREVGLTSVTLESGQKITIREEVYASIPKDRKEEAIQWLDANGYSGLIKTELEVPFTKGQHDQAMDLAVELNNRGFNCAVAETIHPQTLRAFLKEQLGAGRPIPLDVFGARPVSIAVIK